MIALAEERTQPIDHRADGIAQVERDSSGRSPAAPSTRLRSSTSRTAVEPLASLSIATPAARAD